MLSNFKFLGGTILGALFFCSFKIHAQTWTDPQWLNLVIYRKTLMGYESEADDENFFLAPGGKYDPEKELRSLIQNLDNGHSDELKNIHCRFPARIRWLKQFQKIPENRFECKTYDAFKRRISAKSISVVFSSYYLNNPGSMFGHTFLRLGKKSLQEIENESTTTELLDTGINYGAATEGAGPVTFALGGLTGFFSGHYNAIPYYYKVREYNDFETRDLWNYHLDMNQDELDLIVDHIWELGNTRFDYFFLTENCSYHVLSILESARPSLKLHAFLPRLYTIPSETLKALMAEDGLVKKITFRPSASTLFYHQINRLDKNEQLAVKRLVFEGKRISENQPHKKALLYDTSISLVDYKYAKEILKSDEKAQAIKRPLLVDRSKIPVKSPDLDFSEKLKLAPHLGHGQKRLMVSGLYHDNKNYTEFEWRFAFHDILDNDIGYPPTTSLEVMKANLRTDGTHSQLREVSLLDVKTFGNWDTFNKAFSWKARLGQWQTRYDDRDLSTQGFIGGYGISSAISFLSPYVLLHLESSYITEKLNKFKFALGSDTGIIFNFSQHLKFQSSLEWRLDPWDESRFVNEARYSKNNLGLGLFFQDYLSNGMKEVGFKLFLYFQ